MLLKDDLEISKRVYCKYRPTCGNWNSVIVEVAEVIDVGEVNVVVLVEA